MLYGIKRDFEQYDYLSPDFFNLTLEKIIRATDLNRHSTISFNGLGSERGQGEIILVNKQSIEKLRGRR